MVVNQEFIDDLPDDLWAAALEVIKQFEITHQNIRIEHSIEDSYGYYIDILSLYLLVIKDISVSNSVFQLSGSKQNDIDRMVDFFVNAKVEIVSKLNHDMLERAMEKHSLMLSKGFYYEFSDGDFYKIQQLINELRDLINGSKFLTTDHQNRLLKRLELLQSELHKRTNNIDRIYGAFIDFGYTLGRFGEKAKPFFDRLEQMANIVLKIIEKAEGLPSGSLPQLPLPKGGEESE